MALDKEAWVEPEVVAHEPLLDVTGQKYKEIDKKDTDDAN